MRYTLGGWELSGITEFQTGTPFTITNGGLGGTAGDAAGVGNGVGTGSYPDICGNINAPPPVTNVAGIVGPLLYNPGAFCAPQGLTFGNAGRNIMRNPSYLNWDIGLFKDIPIHGERAHLQFRAEAFNLFNTTNLTVTSPTATGNTVKTSCYGGPNDSAGAPGCIASSGFLQATSARAPRILQFSLKFIF